MYEPLQNYLRTYRKRTALSQDDVAFLIGGEAGTSVSRHETGIRVPTLEVALAYQVVLGEPVGDLFAGMLHGVEATIRTRAEELLVRLQDCKDSSCVVRKKLEIVAALVTSDEPITIPIWE